MNALLAGTRTREPPMHAGVNLVELMIALAIGAFMLASILAAYLKAREAQAALEATQRLQEIGRYAMAAIEADVRMAGYWGLTNRSATITAHPSLSFPAKCGGEPWITSVLQALDGENNRYPASSGCAALSGGAQPGTDVLIVRRASAQRISPQRPVVSAPDQDRVLIVTSHTSGQIFVPRDLGNLIPAGYATSDVAGQPPQADTRALLVNAYYVSKGSNTAPGYPALRRKTLTAGPDVADEEVIAGVEDLQFRLGVDSNGDSAADAFVGPDSVPADAMPVSVQVWLLVRAQERARFDGQDIPAYADRSARAVSDGHRRLLISRTIRIRNAET